MFTNPIHSTVSNKSIPKSISGVGIALHTPYIRQTLDERPAIPWLDLLSANHMADSGLTLAQLNIARSYFQEINFDTKNYWKADPELFKEYQ